MSIFNVNIVLGLLKKWATFFTNRFSKKGIKEIEDYSIKKTSTGYYIVANNRVAGKKLMSDFDNAMETARLILTP